MVRVIKKEDAENYLSKADEFLDEARDALLKSRFNAAGLNAIQAIINANDAFTTFIIGKRASKDHREAIKTHIEAAGVIGDSSHRGILRDALASKSEVGYSGRMVSKRIAQDLVRDAIKFVKWTRKYVR
ncbi:MAG: hypothetical protein QMC78_01625 [Methanocellales archaeon]|nr:hypothetical protein [Methanocellales archaeon]